VPTDPGEVDVTGRPQSRQTPLGEPGHHAAPVPRGPAALDQVDPLQPIHQSGHPGAGQQQRVGEVGHPQPSAGRLGQLHEHVIGRQGQLRVGDELGLERPGQPGVRAEELAPGGELVRVGQAFRHPGDGTAARPDMDA
jgi:hypothetical protein